MEVKAQSRVSTDLSGVRARENHAASCFKAKEAVGRQGSKELGICRVFCVGISAQTFASSLTLDTS